MVFKKLLSFIEVMIIITIILGYGNKKAYAQIMPKKETPIRIAVLLYTFNDAYISLVRQSFEEIQNKNEGKVEFTFYNGENNQPVQNQTIDRLLINKNVDLMMVNLVDEESAPRVIDTIKEYNVPVILFNREPYSMELVKAYEKAYYVGTNAAESGILQGKILIEDWNKNKPIIDKNGDNIMQYIMLMGERDSIEAIQRTKYSILTINESGIETKELALKICDWDRKIAKQNVKSIFLFLDDKIEAIISNNDEMAIGAIEALQEYGYNKGDIAKTIPVVGVDAIPAARELINKGEMTGTVVQDAAAMAEACYAIGMNLVYGNKPLTGTPYKFDETGVAVRIPYKGVYMNIYIR